MIVVKLKDVNLSHSKLSTRQVNNIFEAVANVGDKQLKSLKLEYINVSKTNKETLARAVTLIEHVSLISTDITNQQLKAIVTTLNANKPNRSLKELVIEGNGKQWEKLLSLFRLLDVKVSSW